MKERKGIKKKKKENERQKSVYIEGDTASDWSGLWFVGLFYGFFLFNFI